MCGVLSSGGGYMKKQCYGFGLLMLNRCMMCLLSRLWIVSEWCISVMFWFLIVVSSRFDEFWYRIFCFGLVSVLSLVVLNYGCYSLLFECSSGQCMRLVGVCGSLLLFSVGVQVGKNIFLNSGFMCSFGQLLKLKWIVRLMLLCVKLVSELVDCSLMLIFGCCLMNVLMCGVMKCVVNDDSIDIISCWLWLFVCMLCVVLVIIISVVWICCVYCMLVLVRYSCLLLCVNSCMLSFFLSVCIWWLIVLCVMNSLLVVCEKFLWCVVVLNV